mmetsp:Transcript_1494/g.5097  ORF Transcript_1494/g.5097 Transcript_1494/m.5097 type:complete len:316 (-) Transcript_1494:84-1031(-)
MLRRRPGVPSRPASLSLTTSTSAWELRRPRLGESTWLPSRSAASSSSFSADADDRLGSEVLATLLRTSTAPSSALYLYSSYEVSVRCTRSTGSSPSGLGEENCIQKASRRMARHLRKVAAVMVERMAEPSSRRKRSPKWSPRRMVFTTFSMPCTVTCASPASTMKKNCPPSCPSLITVWPASYSTGTSASARRSRREDSMPAMMGTRSSSPAYVLLRLEMSSAICSSNAHLRRSHATTLVLATTVAGHGPSLSRQLSPKLSPALSQFTSLAPEALEVALKGLLLLSRCSTWHSPTSMRKKHSSSSPCAITTSPSL